MEYRQIGNIRVSRLGFGCMRFPLKDDKIDREQAEEMIDFALRHGVNYYDTAYAYHEGESETFLGAVLPGYPRKDWVITDKLPMWLCKKPDDVPRLFEEQLRRCKVEYFDNYMLHALDEGRVEIMRQNGIYEQLTRYKEQGLIKNLGFSIHAPFEVLRDLVDRYDWDLVQIQNNYIDWKLQGAEALYGKLLEKKIPVVVMEPVRGGFLARLPERAQEILAEAGAGDVPATEWALRWCKSKENHTTILSGMSSLEQVKQNIALFSSDKGVSPDEEAVLEQVRDAILEIKTVPCTGCGYCMNCPFGVNIPGVFDVYNIYKLFGSIFRAKGDYALLGKEHQGHNCTGCGACAPMCPQGIDIPARIGEAHKTIDGIVLPF